MFKYIDSIGEKKKNTLPFGYLAVWSAARRQFQEARYFSYNYYWLQLWIEGRPDSEFFRLMT